MQIYSKSIKKEETNSSDLKSNFLPYCQKTIISYYLPGLGAIRLHHHRKMEQEMNFCLN